MSRWPGGAASALLAAVLLAGCGAGAEPGPPRILWGEDLCDHCRMVISEERHAAAARLGGREYRFDDPGCLLELAGSLEGAAGPAWVHDEAGAWRPVEDAWFVEDPEGGTPMASGILAFGSAEAAAAAGGELGVEPRRWSGLTERLEAPDGQPPLSDEGAATPARDESR